jgi:hypothetical protein
MRRCEAKHKRRPAANYQETPAFEGTGKERKCRSTWLSIIAVIRAVRFWYFHVCSIWNYSHFEARSVKVYICVSV